MITLLVTGGSGFWGWNIIRKFIAGGSLKLFSTYNRNSILLKDCNYEKIDLLDFNAVEKLVKKIRPEAIIHTAAISKVNLCEENKKLAYNMNVKLTELLSLLSERMNCRLVFFSTDLVFSGGRGNYLETDIPEPRNYYAETKYIAEQKVRQNCKDHLILRIALSYGVSNNVNTCFTDWMIKAFKNNEKLNLFTGQFRSPVLVDQGVEIIKKLLNLKKESGLLHLGGGERINRYEIGNKMADVFGFDKKLIVPVKTNGTKKDDCSLNSSRISKITGVKLMKMTDGLTYLKNNVRFKV